MAYNDYMDYGVGTYETEEERRKREEREAAERAAAMAPDNIDVGGGFNPASAQGGGFMDAVGNYAQRRFDRAVEPFSDPTAALNRRLGMTPEEAANTEVQSTQVKTYGDGSQEEIVKRQIPAAATAPVNPAEMGAVPTATAQPQQQQKSPEEIARNAQALREMAGQRTPAPAVPTSMPAQGAITAEQAAAVPAQPQLPQFGPPVQVASTQPGAGVAEAARAAQAQATPVAPTPTTPTGAPQVAAPSAAPSLAQAGAQAQAAPAPAVAQPPAGPAWLAAANAAGNDFNKLIDVAAKFPESRGAIQLKLQGVVEEQRKAQEAQKIVEAAQAGDLKAINKLEQSLRPTRGKEREEVTVGDYLKAYMYARLGLNDLSQEVQAKISGRDTKFGQVQLGDTTWSVETNAKTGEIVRAKDDEGNVATPNTLNKLSAAGQKFGTQAFSQTGEIHNTPDGKQVVKVFNSTTGKTQWTDVATGEKWSGTGTPKPQSIATAVAKMDYGVISKYREKFGTDKLAAVNQARKDGIIKSPEDETAFLDRWQFTQGVPGYGSPGGTTTTPPAATTTTPPAATTTTPPAKGPVKPTATATTTATTPTVGGGQPPVRGANEPETVYQNRLKAWETQNAANVQLAKDLAAAEGKPPAEARGKLEAKDINNQNYADSTYGLIKPISDSIRQSTGSSIGAGVDKLAGTIGVGTQGAQNIAKLEVLGYQLLSNVPRFEGPQSDIDVQMYKQAAGDLANSNKPINVRLAALDSIVMMLKKYDKAGKNDWSFGNQGQMRIVKREKVK